jgi:hypothetical protein
MNFLYPAFLVGGLAVAIPIALHFLRRDVAPEVPFSAVRLLQRSPVARSKRRQLRDLLLLAARVAALLLLAAAFARPYIAGASGSSMLRIVAIDRSFSMGAPGRFAHALDLARRAIDDASAGERVALVAFDDSADLLAPPGPASAAKAALENVRAGFGGTRYRAVFAKAAELAGADSGRMILISDLQRAGWEREQRAVLPDALALELEDVGPPPANLSLEAIRVDSDQVVASIHNSGAGARTGRVRVERDGRIAATADYNATPEGTTEVPIRYKAPATGSITVVLDDQQGFAADNARYVVLDPAGHSTILVVTSGGNDSGLYVARVLGATRDRGNDEQRVEAQVVSSEAVAREQDGRRVELAKCSTVILLSTRGLERRAWDSLAAFVRSGGGLVVAAAPDVDPAVLSSIFNWRPALVADPAPPGQDVALSPTDVRHPIFRPFGTLTANLGQVRFERTWRVKSDGWEVVARFTDGSPALLERREDRGRVLLFASDLDRRWNDFPLHPAFVPFTLETLRYAAGAPDHGRDYVVGASPAPAEADARPGIYRASGDGRAVAVNVDTRESDGAAMPPTEFAAMVEHVSRTTTAGPDPRAQQVEARQSYWQYGLLLMMAALVAESLVGRR